MPIVGQKIEITHANFSNMVQKNCLLVDKTPFIKLFLDGPEISLITRPRRFGKTMNLSMLQHFLADEVNGSKTAGLFDQFLITKEDNGEFLRRHQGQYPVILLSLKDLKEMSYDGMLRQMKNLMFELYSEHRRHFESPYVGSEDKEQFLRYLQQGDLPQEALEQALRFLCQFLHKATGKKVVVLLDEYDSPLTASYEYGFLDVFAKFMRNFYSSTFKDNPYLEKGLMTGILRISRENMLSGLNNLKVHTILEDYAAEYFGFTESEVKELIHAKAMEHHFLDDIRRLYNGYRVGETVIYNPWSLMNFLDRKILMAYWVATSNDGLLKKLFLNSDISIKEQLTELMQENTIETVIDVNLRYEELMEKPHALFVLLLFCGYLTVEKKQPTIDQWLCELRVPNREILAQYTRIFREGLEECVGEGYVVYNRFLRSLSSGDIKTFVEFLSNYLWDACSIRDVKGYRPENFYHGLIAGLVASLHETHIIDSNKEAGVGFYDLMLTPRDPQNTLGIIIEFKQLPYKHHGKKVPQMPQKMINAVAIEALKQIRVKQYNKAFKRHTHIQTILHMGLAFQGKQIAVATQRLAVATGVWEEMVVFEGE